MWRPSIKRFLWPAFLTAAVLAVYGSSLSYPFFWVDPIDIGLAGSRSVWTILTNSQGYLYYRPFAFILWKTLFALSGRFDPFAFHLTQVLCHALNTVLFYALVRRLLGNQTLAGLAALCFAWYPASYQTVTWVVSPHVQAMAFLFGSAITYLDGRRAGDVRKLGWSIGLLAVALPFQENAASFGFVIAALEVYLVKGSSQVAITRSPRPLGRLNSVDAVGGPKLSRWPLAHIAVCLAFTALWLLIPKDPESAVARFEPAAGWYLLQGLIWPIAGAVGPWRAWLDGPAWQPLIVVAPPVLVFLFVAYTRARRLALLGLGLAWFAVMILPLWATRDLSYLGTSPRVFYIGAPGAILIWVGLLSLNLQSLLTNRLWRLAANVLLVASLIQSALFLGVRKSIQDGAMPAIWDVVLSGQGAGRQANLLYVNVPDQITPYQREYPVGFFRAVLMPVSVDLGQYAELQTGVRPATRSLAVPALAQLDQFPYQVDVRGAAADQTEIDTAIRAASAVFFTEYDPAGRVRVVEAGGVSQCGASTPCPDVYQATFDGRAGLIDATVAAEGSRQRITLTWDCRGTFDLQETVFVHALDAGGQLVTQADGDPLRNLFPLAECRPGEQVRDVRWLALPSGAYTLQVGIYNRVDGQRLNALDAQGRPIPDQAVRIGQVNK